MEGERQPEPIWVSRILLARCCKPIGRQLAIRWSLRKGEAPHQLLRFPPRRAQLLERRLLTELVSGNGREPRERARRELRRASRQEGGTMLSRARLARISAQTHVTVKCRLIRASICSPSSWCVSQQFRGLAGPIRRHSLSRKASDSAPVVAALHKMYFRSWRGLSPLLLLLLVAALCTDVHRVCKTSS